MDLTKDQAKALAKVLLPKIRESIEYKFDRNLQTLLSSSNFNQTYSNYEKLYSDWCTINKEAEKKIKEAEKFKESIAKYLKKELGITCYGKLSKEAIAELCLKESKEYVRPLTEAELYNLILVQTIETKNLEELKHNLLVQFS